MILNLDPTFRPLQGNELAHEAFTFSGGEPHIKLLGPVAEKVTVTHRLNSFNKVGLLLVAIDALRRAGAKHIEGLIPYFPAARQDRVMVNGEALTVKVYAELINNLNLDKVIIFDPHSDVAPALLDNCKVINNHSFVSKVTKQLPQKLLLVSPDAGAVKKITKLASFLKNYKVLECGKSRDVATGTLSGFKVPIADLEGRDCLIVDDICDGGGTFLGLADVLKKHNAGELYLAVSHGIFSKGSKDLSRKFKKIFTTDSFSDNLEGINYIKLKEIIEQ